MQSDPPIPAEADDTSARGAERLNFFLSATVSCGGQTDMVARVRNLSAGGMMIQFVNDPDTDLEVGDAVTAEMRNIGRIKGEIAWSEAGRYGVRFLRNLDPELARKPNVSGTGTPDHAKALIVRDRSLKKAKSLKGW